MQSPLPVASSRFFPTLMGAFGVAMGFAAFVLVREQTQTRAASPETFVLGLLAASITSYVIESVRERAEGHERGAKVEPGRVLALIVLLAVFEVYVSGAEEVVKLVAGGGASTFVSALFVTGITSTLGIVPQLLFFAGLWIALGAAAAWSMMPDTSTTAPEALSAKSALTSAAWRIGRGLLLVAGIALAYVIVARLVLTIWVLLMRPQDYAPAFDTLLPSSGVSGNPYGTVAIQLVVLMERLAHVGRWGGVLFLTVTAGLTAVLVRSVRKQVPLGLPERMLMVIVGLLVLGPFATNYAQAAQLFRIVSATTLTWISPLVVLAVATPLLRAPSRSPRVWGIVSFAVAVVLVLVTWDRLSEPPVPIFVATFVAALVVTGWLFWRGADVVKFWPLVALTVAIAAFEGSSVLQRLSFLTTFKEAALLQSAPLTGGDDELAESGFIAVAAWERDGSVDAAAAALVATVSALPDSVSDQQVAVLVQNTSTALARAFDVAIAPLCQSSGSPVLDTLHGDIATWCVRVRALGQPSADSAQRLRSALSTAEAPWAGGIGSLMLGADEESTREAFAFRWRAPATAQSLDLAARAAPHLPGERRGEEPSVVLLRAMRDTSIDPSTRVWMVLDAFARSAPPDERMDGWLSDTDPRYVVTGRRGEGLTLEAVLELWRLRAQHLASLVEARYLAGAPTTAPRSQVNLQTRTPDRPARDRRTVTALHFAATQLDQKQQRRARSAALQPDVGATVLLELSLGASFAFWSTAGLLAGLSRRSA